MDDSLNMFVDESIRFSERTPLMFTSKVVSGINMDVPDWWCFWDFTQQDKVQISFLSHNYRAIHVELSVVRVKKYLFLWTSSPPITEPDTVILFYCFYYKAVVKFICTNWWCLFHVSLLDLVWGFAPGCWKEKWDSKNLATCIVCLHSPSENNLFKKSLSSLE